MDEVLDDVLNEKDEGSRYGATRFISLCEGNSTLTMAPLIKYLRQNDRLAEIIDDPAPDGATPLFIACEHGHVHVAMILVVEGGADVDKALPNGVTPLFIACANGHVDVARLLLVEGGADANKAKNDGTTPLFFVCQFGKVEVARLLVEAFADVNKPMPKDPSSLRPIRATGDLRAVVPRSSR